MPAESPDALMRKLRDAVQEKGGELTEDWHVEIKVRSGGKTAGTSDAYYRDGEGHRHRSRTDVLKALGLAESKAAVSKAQAAATARTAAGDMLRATPLPLVNGVLVERLGSMDPRPSFSTRTNLWPVGYKATWQDDNLGSFQSEVMRGDDRGPLFSVTIKPAGKGEMARTLAVERHPDQAWQRVADLQRAGFDAEIAAKAKPRQPKQAAAASPSSASGAAVTPASPSAGVLQEALSLQAAAAAREEQAMADFATPSHTMPVVSGHPAGRAEAAPVDEATKQKQQLLVQAAPLAGCWGLERFGMADVAVLKLLEALPGVEAAPHYEFVEQRGGWDTEASRLRRLQDKQGKATAKATKSLEKKGERLEKLNMSAGGKRKRQEGTADRKKPKTASGKAATSGAGTPAAAAVASEGKGKGRSGGAKKRPPVDAGISKKIESDDTEVEKVVAKMLNMMDRWEENEQEKAARREERKAATAAARAEQRAAKQAAEADDKRAQADEKNLQRAVQGVHDESTKAAVQRQLDSRGEVEDKLLPNADVQAPGGDPVGQGLGPRQTAGLLDLWEFLGRFADTLGLDSVPDPDALAAAMLDPVPHKQVLADVHRPLMELLVEEAFHAILEVSAADSSDIKAHELKGAMPPVEAGSWPELARRYFALAATAALVRSTEASGGLDTALGHQHAGCTPLAALGPLAIQQGLLAGSHDGNPEDAGIAGLPLGACKAAPESIQARQDAQALASAAAMCLGAKQPGAMDVDVDAQQLQRRCRLTLHSLATLKGSKLDSGPRANTHSFYRGAWPAAAAARSGMPLSLQAVAARVDAGYYAEQVQGWEAFADDIRHVCHLWQAAAKRQNSPFAEQLRAKGVPEMGDIILASLESLMAQSEASLNSVPGETSAPDSRAGSAGRGAEETPPKARKKAEQLALDLGRPFCPVNGCCVCWQEEDSKQIILCETCDAEYHIYCLQPPLQDIPDGEFYCPRCKAEQDGNSAGNGGLQPQEKSTRLMQLDKAYQRLATALGQHEYEDLLPEERVEVAVLLCSLANGTAYLRNHFDELEEDRKTHRKELMALKAKMKKDAQERAAAAKAAADISSPKAAEAGATPAGKKGVKKGDKGSKAPEDAAAKANWQKWQESNVRTRKQLEESAAGDIEADQARVRELAAKLREGHLRKDLLGFDRHWNRYWLLGASFTTGGEQDARPGWVFQEKAAPPPAEKLAPGERLQPSKQQLAEHARREAEAGFTAAGDEDALGLKQESLRDRQDWTPKGTVEAKPSEKPSHRLLVIIPEDQGPGQGWAWYKTPRQLDLLIRHLNPKGVRESALRKELLQLQKVVGVPTPEPEPEQPAAEAALEAPPAQKALSKRSLAAEVAMLSGPSAAVVPQPEGGRDAAVLANGDAAEPGAVAEQASTAAGSANAAGVVPMQEDGAAAAANTAAAAAAAAPEAVAAVVDPLQALKEELLAVLDWVPFDAFHRVRGSPERREQLRGVVLAAQTSKVLAAAVLVLEGMLTEERWKPHWRLWRMPAPHPSIAGTSAAVRLRLQAMKPAIKRSAAAKDATYAHGGGGYRFRQATLAEGALAESSEATPSAGEDSAVEDRAAPEAAKDKKVPKARAATNAKAVSRAASEAPSDEEEQPENDEDMARALQAQLNNSRGRATRAAQRADRGGKRSVQGRVAQSQRPRGRPSGPVSRAGKRASSRLTTSSRNPTPSDVPEDETSPEQSSSSSSEDDDAEDPDVQMDEAAAASEAASDDESSEDSGEEGSDDEGSDEGSSEAGESSEVATEDSDNDFKKPSKQPARSNKALARAAARKPAAKQPARQAARPAANGRAARATAAAAKPAAGRKAKETMPAKKSAKENAPTTQAIQGRKRLRKAA